MGGGKKINNEKGKDIKIGFLNANGIPTGNKNLHKFEAYEKFQENNKINVFLETGCTKELPKIFNSKWKIC